MFTKIKQAAVVGAALVSVGWVTFAITPAASALPLPIPQDNPIECPDNPGVHYLRDPQDSRAFYTCADGSQRSHEVCPASMDLELDAGPPRCTSREGFGKP